ncbi:hypothetical protein NBRC116589_44410 [Ruegeria sp. HU-ET01832]
MVPAQGYFSFELIAALRLCRNQLPKVNTGMSAFTDCPTKSRTCGEGLQSALVAGNRGRDAQTAEVGVRYVNSRYVRISDIANSVLKDRFGAEADTELLGPKSGPRPSTWHNLAYRSQGRSLSAEVL